MHEITPSEGLVTSTTPIADGHDSTEPTPDEHSLPTPCRTSPHQTTLRSQDDIFIHPSILELPEPLTL